jgi:hypothetical protein
VSQTLEAPLDRRTGGGVHGLVCLSTVLWWDRPQMRKLFRKATMVIPKDLYNDDEAYIQIWLGTATCEA